MSSVGDRIDRYVIEAVLGEGGMGRVYRAFDPRLGRRVAIKVLVAEGASPEARAGAAARMIREARAAAAFNHPNVVAIYDVGTADDAPYIAMELVSGTALRAYVGSPAVTLAEKLAWLLDVGRGLGAAHRSGLVHRDVKPDNVMITTDGVVKILDFGIARRAEGPLGAEHSPTREANLPVLTAGGVILGTLPYMAPEQLEGEALDGRADQFSWGVMAWELLAGRLPWAKRSSGAGMVAAILTASVAPLSEEVPGLDPSVSRAIARAVSKDRAARFPTMEDLLSAMEGPMEAHAPPGVSRLAFEPTIEAESAPEARRTRTRGRARRLAIGGAAATVALAAFAYRAARAPRTLYCADVIETTDGPRCARPIAASAVARRGAAWTYAVSSVLGRVAEVRYVDFAKNDDVIEDPVPKVARFELVRSEEGALREQVARDALGNVLVRWKVSRGGRDVDIVGPDGEPAGLDAEIADPRVTHVVRDFDARGFLVKERFFGVTGKPRADARGAYGHAFTIGPGGERTQSTVLGADGEPGVDRAGRAFSTFARDEAARTLVERRFGLDGRPTALAGVHAIHTLHGPDDQILRVSYFGAGGEPVSDLDDKDHGYVGLWNPERLAFERTLLGVNGAPRASGTNTWVTVRDTYDARGRWSFHEHFDVERNRVRDRHEGATAVRWLWSERDQMIGTELLDVGDALVSGEDGFARQTWERDARGRIVESRSFDPSGGLTAPRDGAAIERTTYDDRNLRTSTSYFGPDEHPTSNAHGVAVERVKYDRSRNEIERAYFGVDGRPIASDEGFATRKRAYDADENLALESFFEETGAPVIVHGDHAARRITSDDRGLVVAEEYLDVHGEPMLNRDGYALVRYERDRSGEPTRISYFGKRAEPVLASQCHCAGTRLAYDGHRRLTETAFLDREGRPTANGAGVHLERLTYDDRGLAVRTDHRDASGAPFLTGDGAASITRKYDERGNLVEETQRGVADEPVSGARGFATERWTYDDRDQPIEEALLGPAGEPVVGAEGWSLKRYRYDDVGNRLESAFFDADHHLVVPKAGTYASVRSRYDARGHVLEMVYRGASEDPAPGPEGAAVVTYTRDAYGRATEIRFLDASRTPSPSNDGKLVVRVAYDDAGRVVGERSLDAEGAPRVAKDGCAERRTTYDPQGRVAEERCLGTDGAPTLAAAGWATRRTSRDVRGNAIDVATFGPDGALKADSDGVARRRSAFDARGNVLTTTFFDAHERPTRDRAGHYGTVCSYDDAGRKTGETGLDAQGRAMPGAPRTGE